MRRSKDSIDYVVEDRGYVTPCWIWQWSKNDLGYGKLRDEFGVMRYAHCIYYERAHGPIPKGMVSDHLCRVRACCNPDHIEVVTQSINAQRGNAARINAETAIAIRQCHHLKFSQIAERFGVSVALAKGVYYGYTWRNVPFTPPPPRKRGPKKIS